MHTALTAALACLERLVRGEDCIVQNPDDALTPLSSLRGTSGAWQAEAELIVAGCPPMGATDPVIRGVVLPIFRAIKILTDDSDRNRFTKARPVLERITAEDWRMVTLKHLDHEEQMSKIG